MKREINRQTDLPAFEIGLAELELLWTRLEPLFENSKYGSNSVSINFSDEKLTFDSLEELRSAQFPKSTSTSFTLHFLGSGRSVYLTTSGFFGDQAKLRVTAESEVWAAGAREVVLTLINQNRTWHHWLRPGFLAATLFFGIPASAMVVSYLQKNAIPVGRFIYFGVGGTFAVGALLFFARAQLLPMARLRLSSSESFWRRHSTEITLLLALVSALLTAYGAFAPKSGA